MFSIFRVSTKCKSHFCDHTELQNFVLGKYLLTAVCWMGNCLSSEHYAWIICLLLLLASSAEYLFYPVNHRATGCFAFFILLKNNEEPVNLLKSMKLSWTHKVSICFVNQNLKQITQIILQTNITKFQIHFVFLCIKGAQYIKPQTLPHSELFCLFISASQVDPPGQEFHRYLFIYLFIFVGILLVLLMGVFSWFFFFVVVFFQGDRNICMMISLSRKDKK